MVKITDEQIKKTSWMINAVDIAGLKNILNSKYIITKLDRNKMTESKKVNEGNINCIIKRAEVDPVRDININS